MVAITDLAMLEERVGTPSPLVFMKMTDRLDEGALGWIAASPLMIASFADARDVSVTLGGGRAGWAGGDARELRLPAAALDDPSLAVPGTSFGSSFLVPSLNEILRVNGRVAANDGRSIAVEVEECYIHCGKALIRSDFWAPRTPQPGPDELPSFAQATRFMALATVDAAGRGDLSPKGDPAGLMVRLDGDTLWFADRPGNKRIDSFRNIVSQPKVAALLVTPGTVRVAEVTGVARIDDDEEIRDRFAVGDKVPELATGIAATTARLRDSASLVRAALWPARAAPAEVNAGKIAVGHLKLAKAEAAQAAAEKMAAPGVAEAAMQADYRNNLY